MKTSSLPHSDTDATLKVAAYQQRAYDISQIKHDGNTILVVSLVTTSGEKQVLFEAYLSPDHLPELMVYASTKRCWLFPDHIRYQLTPPERT